MQEKIAQLVSENSEVEAKLREATEDIERSACESNKKGEELSSRILDLEASLEAARIENRDLHNASGDQHSHASKLAGELEEALQQSARQQEELEESHRKYEELSTRQHRDLLAFRGVREEVAELRTSLHSANAMHKEALNDASELRSQLKEITAERDQALEGLNAAEETLEDSERASEEISGLRRELDAAQKLLSAAKDAASASEKKLAATRDDFKRQAQRHAHEKNVLEDVLQKKTASLETTIADLDQYRASYSSGSASSAEVRKLKAELRRSKEEVKSLKNSMVTELAKFRSSATRSAPAYQEQDSIESCSSGPDESRAAMPSMTVTGRKRRRVNQDIEVEASIRLPGAVSNSSGRKRKKPSARKPKGGTPLPGGIIAGLKTTPASPQRPPVNLFKDVFAFGDF
eukprot:TRINITY_DN1527_c1_g1_i1.p1 TRINITY_DN1527_c1_g1~~TRINITY_DN1527_c1_g1_i1.p1  ORF type:complete len:407 (+),score=103.71 TRINITY_DN1527_c1_g1_i1:809-2029(+)